MDKPQTLEAYELDSGETALLFNIEWSSVLPSSIRLFGAGITQTSKGEFLFDDESAAMVMDAYLAQGQDLLPFDAAHGMLNKNAPPDSHKSLGWFRPVVRDDVEHGGGLALFADEIQWTEGGADSLNKREWRFFSPAVIFDPESKRIKKLINVALTNIPATKNQTPLVLDGLGESTQTEKQETMQVLLDSLGASDESGAVSEVNGLKSFKAETLAALDGVSVGDIVGKVAALSAELATAQAEIANVSAQASADKREGEVAALCAEGKLQPAQKAFAASLSAEQFEAFSATLTGTLLTKIDEKGGESLGALSADDKVAADQLGLSYEEFAVGKEEGSK